jgi:hypothetical protein
LLQLTEIRQWSVQQVLLDGPAAVTTDHMPIEPDQRGGLAIADAIAYQAH